MNDNDKQRQKLQELEDIASQECQRYQKYYEKMEDQRKIVIDIEKAFVTQHELQAQNQIVNDLQLKSNDPLLTKFQFCITCFEHACITSECCARMKWESLYKS